MDNNKDIDRRKEHIFKEEMERTGSPIRLITQEVDMMSVIYKGYILNHLYITYNSLACGCDNFSQQRQKDNLCR